MTVRRALLAVLPLVAVLSACDRGNPPSEQLESAAEALVAEVDGESLPPQPTGPYAPRDECLDQPGAGEFLAALRTAAASRDTEAVVALAAEDIYLDFGGGAGRDELRARLNGEDDYLWLALDDVLTLGCASDGATMTLPWYFAQTIPVDPFEGLIVTGEDVPMYAAADPASDLVARFSWDVVTLTAYTTEPGDEFLPVGGTNPESGERVEGFMAMENLRSIIDYRIGAARRNGRWHMTSFIAGD